MKEKTSTGAALTHLILALFQANGALLAAGNRLTKPFGLTSARWQVMGAIELAGRALTVAQIARRMGLSRQGVQRIVNDLVGREMVQAHDNIDHKRANLFALSPKGQKAMAKINDGQAEWVNHLSEGMNENHIKQALALLTSLSQKI